MTMLRRLLHKILMQVAVRIYKLEGSVATRLLPEFGNKPDNLKIAWPYRIFNPHRIEFGDDVRLGPGSFLLPHQRYPSKMMNNPDWKQSEQVFDSRIIIGHRVSSTESLQISAFNKVVIEEDVMFASNIHINDGFHGYENAHVPYKYQKIIGIKPIVIKRGCWIGQNVVILPGVVIGEQCVIGANSVVTRSIPPRSIAFGNPAKVIKKWHDDSNSWQSVEESE